MSTPTVVSQEQWLEARKRLLAKEKELTHLRDELSRQRREMPWVRVDKQYVFDTPDGKQTLADLFAGRHQLIVQHFMFNPSSPVGCKSCSFWADGFNGFAVHLEQRDLSFVAVSAAPLEKIAAFRKRMGWSFKWVSSNGCDFNSDYQVSETTEEKEKGQSYYNYSIGKPFDGERPGISVFYRDNDGAIYHTYSSYSRGLDMMNAAYHYLDLTPKGRDEDNLPFTMSWVRLHDEYGK